MLFCNVIICIGVCVFGDFESFCFLYLDGNRLVEFGIGSFWGFVNLQYFIFSGNQLGCIVLGVFDDFFESLEDLDLFYNNFWQVFWVGIGVMFVLYIFNLDYNFIDVLFLGVFVQFGQFFCLDFIFNCLVMLVLDLFFFCGCDVEVFFVFLVLSFSGNFLYCNCELLWLWWLVWLDDLEICVFLFGLVGCYFWVVFEGEFFCELFFIVCYMQCFWVLEGQQVILWCWVLGDFMFIMYWVGFDDWLVGNFF